MLRNQIWYVSIPSDVPQLTPAFTAGGKAAAAVFSAEDGEAIVKTALDTFGGVHVLVANAGVLRDRSFTAMTEQEWDIVMAVHLRGTYKVFVTSVSLLVDSIDIRQVRESGLAYFPKAEIRSNCYDLLTSWHLYVRLSLYPHTSLTTPLLADGNFGQTNVRILFWFLGASADVTNLVFDGQGCYYGLH